MNFKEPVDELEETVEDDCRIKAEECLDVSLSDVQLKEFSVNVGKKSSLAQIVEDENEDVSFVGVEKVVHEEEIEINSTQGPFNEIPATQEVNVSKVVFTQQEPVYIPETQRFTAPDFSEKEEVEEIVPATPPEEPKSRGGKKRLVKEQTKPQSAPVQKSNKRHLSITSTSSSPHVASPIRKSRREDAQITAEMSPLISKKLEDLLASPQRLSRSVTVTTPTIAPRLSTRSVTATTPTTAPRLSTRSVTATTPTTAPRLSTRSVTATTPTVGTPRTKKATTERVNLPKPVKSQVPAKTQIPSKSQIPVKKASNLPTKSTVVAPRTTGALRTITKSKIAQPKTTTSSIESSSIIGTSTRRIQPIQDVVQTKDTTKVTINKTTFPLKTINKVAVNESSQRTRRVVANK